MDKETAKSMLPNRAQVGVYRDSKNNDEIPPHHSWWSKDDCEAAIDRFGCTMTTVVSGHPITVEDAVGILYIEAV